MKKSRHVKESLQRECLKRQVEWRESRKWVSERGSGFGVWSCGVDLALEGDEGAIFMCSPEQTPQTPTPTFIDANAIC
jgi:hypothetical protein